MSRMTPELVQQISTLFDRAAETPTSDPTAVTLATVGADGQPTARVVLIRRLDERGFVFFTNSRSTKGRQLQENSKVALCFFWDALDVQLRIEGHTEQVSAAEADAYWESRPRESQIGAWASDQSQPLRDLSELESRVAEAERQYEGQTVPRPPHWVGYRVIPQRIEFWSRGDARLHERVVYSFENGGWTKGMRYP